MEVWIDEKKPEVLSTTNVVLALVIHVLFFIAVFTFAKFHFKPKETIIPIDLTVVVNENLDGVEDEPPPLDDPPPEPPKPTPVEPTPPPPPPVKENLDAVVKVPEKKIEKKKPEKKPEKKVEEKKPEVKKPEPPKKTKEQLRQEKLDRIRKNAKKVNIKIKDVPSGNGRTERQTMSEDEIRKLLGAGYAPSSTTRIAGSEMQYCVGRIKQAIDARWSEVNPRVGAEGMVVILVRVNSSGRLVNCRLVSSCGDKTSDAAALTVVKTVKPISGLSREFIKKFSREDLPINYKVVAR